LSHVRDAIYDLQREVKDSYHMIVRAIEALEIAADDLAARADEIENDYSNLQAVDRAAGSVRSSIAKATSAIYDAVDDVARAG
jgi:ABC-type transporter Mla subunit MlaD